MPKKVAKRGAAKGKATKGPKTKTGPKTAKTASKPAKSPPKFITKEVLEHFGSRLSPMNQQPSSHGLYNVCALLIHCPTHKKIAVGREVGNNYSWLPFVSIPKDELWKDAAEEGAYIIISDGEPNRFVALKEKKAVDQISYMELFRLQIPQTQKFNERLTYYVKLKPKTEGCCTDTKRVTWLPLSDVKHNKVANLFGPELVQFAKEIRSTIDSYVVEYSLDEAFKYVPRDPPRNLEEEMLKSTNFSEKDVERLYGDFIEHCFPSFYMTLTSFSDYMSKYGFEKMDRKLGLLFKAFNFNKKGQGFLNFHEFLLGLTSIDPMATNGQSRIKFLFKYFDVDGDGYLSQKEFTSMIREMNPNEKTESVIQKKVKQQMEKIGCDKKGVPFDKFFKAVGAHRFRGTSNLCRSNRPILAQISRSMATRSLRKVAIKANLTAILNDHKYEGTCPTCKEKIFNYAKHIVTINSDGRVKSSKHLKEFSNIERNTRTQSKTESKTDSSEKSVQSNGSQRSTAKSSSTGIISLSDDRFSEEIVWNKKSVANYFIEQVRDFNSKKGTKDQKKGLFDQSAERKPFVDKLKELCVEVEKMVSLEDRCVKVSSPAFVIGDIHGNLEDLMTMEKVLWRSFPIVAANFVFLGDYVDRGQWGLECALYLMCMKVLAPKKVTLLRGNHEIKALQEKYSYKKELKHKYGDHYKDVYEATNAVFNKLPFCAVIDDAIFCAHGGIPCSQRMIEKINEIKNDLPDPEHDSSVAWEIMWSDPIGATQFAESAELLQVRVDTARGFLTNSKRGTAYLFAEEAANTFLQANELTHIIRAHEVPANGYTFHFGNKCVTIFSCSHYCGNNNEAAVIHVDSEKLRVVKLDTVNNAAAS